MTATDVDPPTADPASRFSAPAPRHQALVLLSLPSLTRMWTGFDTTSSGT